MSLAGQSLLTSSPGSHFHINLLFDTSTASAPAGFFTQIIQAAQFLDATFSNDITVNIEVGWGEIAGDPISSRQAVAEASQAEWYLPYDGVAYYLANAATSANDAAAIAHLPASDPLGGGPGDYDWGISSAQFRLFDPGDFPSTPQIDGAIGFSTAWKSDWLGAALHEISHALGRVSGAGDDASPGDPYAPTVFDLFRYASAGHLKLSDGAGYLSIDGGATKLANFGVTSDSSDFKNDTLSPKDPFDEVASGDAWTTLDSVTMDVLGFTLSDVTPPSPTTTLPNLGVKSLAFDGESASWTVTDSGSGVALPTVSGLYLSSDKTVTTSDTLLGTVDTSGLAGGHSQGESLAVALSDSLAPGTYYLGAIANVIGDVAETKTTDNISNLLPILVGGSGSDTLKGTSTIHDIYGFGGDDVLYASSGSNVLDGGLGDDRAVLNGAFASYKMSQSGDALTLKNGSGSDTLYGIEVAQFSDRQMVLGGSGETLTARASKDTLVGGAGDDTLIASAGTDVMTGGGGADHFIFGSLQDLKVSKPDQITDFDSGLDVIDLSALDSVLPSGHAFELSPTGGQPGDITIAYDAGHHRTAIDLFVNDDGKPDAVLWLTGQHTDLASPNFIL